MVLAVGQDVDVGDREELGQALVAELEGGGGVGGTGSGEGWTSGRLPRPAHAPGSASHRLEWI